MRALHRINKRSEAYATFFGLTSQESGEFVDDFVCALQKRILLQGRMYLFENYLCFHCNIFGYTKKKRIPLTKVKDIRKARTVGFIPNAIVVTWDREREDSVDTVSEFFTSFIFRDFVYEKLAYVLSKITSGDPIHITQKSIGPLKSTMLGSLHEAEEEEEEDFDAVDEADAVHDLGNPVSDRDELESVQTSRYGRLVRFQAALGCI